jgi:hypothetical protein
MWINPDDNTDVNLLGNSSVIANFLYINSSNQLQIASPDLATTFTNTTFTTGSWQHVLLTRDSSNVFKAYKNGVLTDTSSADAGSFAFNQIGRYGAVNTYDFNGKLSNVAIWNSDQSANKDNIYNYGAPQTSYTVTPTAWYKLDKTSRFTGLNPNWHNALDFDGSSNYINCSNNSSLQFQPTDAFSLSCWFKADSYSSNSIIVSNNEWSGAYRGYNIQLKSTGALQFTLTSNYVSPSDNTNINIASTTTINTGTWYHLVITKDTSIANTGLNMYINGSPASVTRGGGGTLSAFTYASDFNIGSADNGSQLFNGQISNASIFNQVISAEDVKYLYNGGTPQTNISFEPISWWKLDNLTTGIQDSGSASNNGTNNGATEVSTSVAVDEWVFDNAVQLQTPNWSSALDFDENNDYVDLGTTTDYDTGDLSVSIWVNASSSRTGTGYAISNSGSTAYAGFDIAINTSEQIRLRRNTATQINDPGWVSIGFVEDTWQHLAFTYNDSSNTLKLFLNGVLKNTTTGTSQSTAVSRKLTIGSYKGTLNFFGGEISNAAIFNTELNAAAISTLYNSGQPETAISSSPVSWYKLDNITTGIQDSGSASNNGTNNGATEIQTNVWTPRLNGESSTLPSSALTSSDLQFNSAYSSFSLNFDQGSSDVINIPNNSIFNLGSSFTISGWFNFASNKYQGLISFDNSSPRGWFLYQLNDNSIRLFDGSSAFTLKASYTTTNQWDNFIVTYDGTDLVFYINGAQESTQAVSVDLQTNGNNGQIGNNQFAAGRFFDGRMDECSIFNKALNQAEVTSIYNNGYPKDITALAPISWWRLGEDAYFDGTNFTVPNQITTSPNGTSANMTATDLVANAPGSYAAGLGSSLSLADRVGDAALSTANSLSFNMTPVNRVSYPAGYAPTQADNVYSMAFDGASDYFTTSNAFTSLTSFSISAWFKSDDTVTAAQAITSSRINAIGTSQGLDIYLGSNTLVARVYNNGATEVTTAFTDTTSWHHVAMTYNGTTLEMYLDGVSKGTATGVYTNSAADWLIGKWNGGANYFNGNIDEVAIFDYALSARQIKQDIYNGTTSGKTADLNNISNLTPPVAWYRMGD